MQFTTRDEFPDSKIWVEYMDASTTKADQGYYALFIDNGAVSLLLDSEEMMELRAILDSDTGFVSLCPGRAIVTITMTPPQAEEMRSIMQYIVHKAEAYEEAPEKYVVLGSGHSAVSKNGIITKMILGTGHNHITLPDLSFLEMGE